MPPLVTQFSLEEGQGMRVKPAGSGGKNQTAIGAVRPVSSSSHDADH